MGVNKATKTHDPLWVGQSHTMINRQIAFVQESLEKTQVVREAQRPAFRFIIFQQWLRSLDPDRRR